MARLRATGLACRCWLVRSSVLLLLAAVGCWRPVAAAADPAAAPPAAQHPGITVNVTNGYELHAALTSPDVDSIIMLTDITMTMDTCPAPHTNKLPPTERPRSITIMAPPSGPYYFFSCSWMPARLLFKPGSSVTFRHVQLRQCSGPQDLMIFDKAPGASVVLDDVIENLDNICLPPDAAAAAIQALQRPPAVAAAPAAQHSPNQQQLRVADPGTNWCTPGNTPGIPKLQPYNQTLCSLRALLLQDVAFQQPTVDSTGDDAGYWTIVYRNTLKLCPQPLPTSCLDRHGVTACAQEAYDQRNPDKHRLQPVEDAYGLQQLLEAPPQGILGALLLANISFSLGSSPPLAAGQTPPLLDQDFLIRADPRGPRLYVDCCLLTDRFRLAPGRTLYLEHLVLSNCSVTSPFSFVTMSPGAVMNLTDTFVRPGALCVPLADKMAETLHAPRPAAYPGVQQLRPADAGTWCHTSGAHGMPQESPLSSLPANSSTLQLAGLVKSTYLLDDADLADLQPTQSSKILDAMNWAIPEPAGVPYYINPSWHGIYLCNRSALLLPDMVLQLPAHPPASSNSNSTAGGTPRRMLQQLARPSSTPQQHSKDTYTVLYNNSAWLPCPRPIRNCSNPQDSYSCLATAYQLVDPDLDPAAVAAGAAERAAYLQQQQQQEVKVQGGGGAGGGGGGRSQLAVVLPAVLASVVGALCIAAMGLLLYRRHHQHAPSSPVGGLQLGCKEGTAADKLMAGSNARSSGARSCGGGTSSILRDSSSSAEAPKGITLGVLLGAGSYGRVYKGSWHGQLVAVKVLAHTCAEEPLISRELGLAAALSHPHLVATLYYARLQVAGSHANSSSSLPTPGTPSAGSDLTLPPGAVGVFRVGSGWTLGDPSAPSSVPDMETWMVLELMDRGNLAAAVRGGTFINPLTRGVRQAPLLRRLCDVAAGVSYLHQTGVCHGDLKCENVLLKSEVADPDGCVAKVADFGLSRALAAGQSHLSTRRYGTVSHMPPELLSTGRLTTAADVYSFGIIMWEAVSCARPYEGLHHGEIIHKVVSQGLRPGPWPLEVPQEYILVATSCWSQDPEARPAMPDVLAALTSLLHLVELPAGGGHLPPPHATATTATGTSGSNGSTRGATSLRHQPAPASSRASQ